MLSQKREDKQQAGERFGIIGGKGRHTAKNSVQVWGGPGGEAGLPASATSLAGEGMRCASVVQRGASRTQCLCFIECSYTTRRLGS